MKPPNPTLPLDVITEIIEHLEHDVDLPTLRTLSTTSWDVLEPSQWLRPQMPTPQHILR